MGQLPSRPWSESFTTPRHRPNTTGRPIRLPAWRGRLRLRRDPRQIEPEGTAALRQSVRRDLSRVRIEHLLMEVDARCRFSRYLTPPTAEASTWNSDDLGQLPPERRYSALMASVVAHGTNLGISAMADSTEDLTVRMLQHVSRTCVRDETIRRANAAIVNYHRTLDTSQYWGEGKMASSDGQRFGVRGSSLLAAFYPRYFGYYDCGARSPVCARWVARQ
jgi:hypothetical protein